MKKSTYVAIVILILINIVGLYLYWSRPVTLDVTKNIKIECTGLSGEGIIEVASNDIKVKSKKYDEFLNKMTYSIAPNNNLKNDDIVTITVIYDDALRKKLHINVINEKKQYKVDKLDEMIDGIRVPGYLSDSEKKEYIEAAKYRPANPGPGRVYTYEKGESKTKTNYENRTFIAYKAAHSYGLSSSQEFLVVPLVDDSYKVTYRVVFKGTKEADDYIAKNNQGDYNQDESAVYD